MDEEEIQRNRGQVLFKPCEICEGQFERNPDDEYQTYGRVDDGGGDANF
jgi:hypothetical protein